VQFKRVLVLSEGLGAAPALSMPLCFTVRLEQP